MAGVSVGDSVKRDEDGQSEESSESKKKIKEIRGKSGRRAFVSRRNQVAICALTFESKGKFRL